MILPLQNPLAFSSSATCPGPAFAHSVSYSYNEFSPHRHARCCSPFQMQVCQVSALETTCNPLNLGRTSILCFLLISCGFLCFSISSVYSFNTCLGHPRYSIHNSKFFECLLCSEHCLHRHLISAITMRCIIIL